MKKLSMAVALIAMAITGCVSVEGTRTQLNSKDAAEVKKAEETIYAIATTGKDPVGIAKFTSKEQAEYVKLTSSNELLERIVDNARDAEVIAVAVDRIDFSKKGVAYAFARQRFGRLMRIGGQRQYEMKKMIVSKMTQEELLALLDGKAAGGDGGVRNVNAGSRRGIRMLEQPLSFEEQDLVADRLSEITDSPDVLVRMFERSLKQGRHADRLLTMLDKVTDEKTIEKLLSRQADPWPRIDKSSDRILLLKKLPQEKMVGLALRDIDGYNASYWREGDRSALETGIGIIAYVKDEKSAVKIAKAVFSKIEECHERYNESNSIRVWGKNEWGKVEELVAKLPALSDSAIAELVCFSGLTWDYLIDKVTPDNAYRILTEGKAKYGDLEVALVKKLQPEKVDLKVYAGVKTDAGKKAVLAAMPPEARKAAQEVAEKAFAAVVAKAKEASKETFELQGFYLGMDWEDMKVVLAHHFPDCKITEDHDNNGNGDAYVAAYVSGQKTPFCYALKKDRKVYQFNFGKKILKNWYKYDVQSYREWAKAFARENGVDMRYKMLEEVTDEAWFHQEAYQYKHNAKEYRLTYFGDEKYGGDRTPSAEHKRRYYSVIDWRVRYVRDDPGTLRAVIERD